MTIDRDRFEYAGDAVRTYRRRAVDFVNSRLRVRFLSPAPMEDAMDAEERARLIKRYRDGHRVVMDALKGITDEELDRSASGEWTPRQTAHHLADSEMMSAIRIRRLLAEDKPVIYGYDEATFARKLTSDRPIEPSLEAMRWARETCAQLIERMTEEDWHIVGTHTESGTYSTEDWLKIYAAHAHDHAEQIKRARGKS